MLAALVTGVVASAVLIWQGPFATGANRPPPSRFTPGILFVTNAEPLSFIVDNPTSATVRVVGRLTHVSGIGDPSDQSADIPGGAQ
jgi:hypothetical protein